MPRMAARASCRGRRDSSGHLDPHFQRRQRYQAVLGAIGLWEPFAAMPRPMQEIFLQRKLPDPQLEFDGGFPFDREGRLLRKKLEFVFRRAGFKIDAGTEWGAGQMYTRDFIAVLAGSLFV